MRWNLPLQRHFGTAEVVPFPKLLCFGAYVSAAAVAAWIFFGLTPR